jgi:hypothetical protein
MSVRKNTFKMKYNITANDEDMEHDRKNNVKRTVMDNILRLLDY